MEIQKELRVEGPLDTATERILIYTRAGHLWRTRAQAISRSRGRPRSTQPVILSGMINSSPKRTPDGRKHRAGLACSLTAWVAGRKLQTFVRGDGLPNATLKEALDHVDREDSAGEVVGLRGNAELVRQFIHNNALDPKLQQSFEKAVSRALRSFLVEAIRKR